MIEYEVTQVRTIRVAAGTADGAIAVALAQESAGWTDQRLEASYIGSAAYKDLPGDKISPQSQEEMLRAFGWDADPAEDAV